MIEQSMVNEGLTDMTPTEFC